MTLYRCPIHGLIESPTFYGPPYAVVPEDEHYYCPINLSSDEHGITDDLCQETCKPVGWVAQKVAKLL